MGVWLELADAHVLEICSERSGGSRPLMPTKKEIMKKYLIIFITIFLSLLIFCNLFFELIKTPHSLCVHPNGWRICNDFSMTGIRISSRNNSQWLGIYNIETWDLVKQENLCYILDETREILIQSSLELEGIDVIGNCSIKVYGICFMYDESEREVCP